MGLVEQIDRGFNPAINGYKRAKEYIHKNGTITAPRSLWDPSAAQKKVAEDLRVLSDLLETKRQERLANTISLFAENVQRQSWFEFYEFYGFAQRDHWIKKIRPSVERFARTKKPRATSRVDFHRFFQENRRTSRWGTFQLTNEEAQYLFRLNQVKPPSRGYEVEVKLPNFEHPHYKDYTITKVYLQLKTSDYKRRARTFWELRAY